MIVLSDGVAVVEFTIMTFFSSFAAILMLITSASSGLTPGSGTIIG